MLEQCRSRKRSVSSSVHTATCQVFLHSHSLFPCVPSTLSSPFISAAPHPGYQGSLEQRMARAIKALREEPKEGHRQLYGICLGLTSPWQNAASRWCLCCPQPSSKGCLHSTGWQQPFLCQPLTPPCSCLSAFSNMDSAMKHKPVAC